MQVLRLLYPSPAWRWIQGKGTQKHVGLDQHSLMIPHALMRESRYHTTWLTNETTTRKNASFNSIEPGNTSTKSSSSWSALCWPLLHPRPAKGMQDANQAAEDFAKYVSCSSDTDIKVNFLVMVLLTSGMTFIFWTCKRPPGVLSFCTNGKRSSFWCTRATGVHGCHILHTLEPPLC